MRLTAGTVGYGACPGAWAGRSEVLWNRQIVCPVALGQSPDPEKIDSLTLSVYAAREFETSDPDFADVLFRIQYLAARMP
jgi:hypothetical protein